MRMNCWCGCGSGSGLVRNRKRDMGGVQNKQALTDKDY